MQRSLIDRYKRLKSHFNFQEENVHIHRMIQIAYVNEQILQALDIDTQGVFPATPPDITTGDRSYKDEWGIERVNPPGTWREWRLYTLCCPQYTV